MTAVSIFDVTADMIRPVRPWSLESRTDHLFAELLALPPAAPRSRARTGRADSYGIPEAESLRLSRRYCMRCGISFARCPARGDVCADCVDAP